MLLAEYDLRLVEHRFRELRKEAAANRLADAVAASSSRHRSLSAGFRTLATRLHLTRSVASRTVSPA
jgi:hypothetical protein